MKGSWPQIIEMYDELIALWGMDNPYARDVAGVAAVAKHINRTWLRDCLFGGTSMHSLKICQIDLPDLQAGRDLIPHLYIGPYHHRWGVGGGVLFAYVENNLWSGGKKWPQNREREWHRVVQPDQAVDRFNRFLDQLRWVSSQNAAALMASTPAGSDTL